MTFALRSEGERQESQLTTEEQLALAVDALSEHVVLFDSRDRIVLANKAWRELNEDVIETTEPGSRFEDHLQALLDKGLVPEAVGREEAWLRDRMERHRDPRGPFEVSRQDGRWIRVHEHRLANDGTILIITDITSQKRAEEAMRQSEQRLREIIESLPIAFHLWSPEGRLIMCNENQHKWFPHNRESMYVGARVEEHIRSNVEQNLVDVEPGREEEYIQRRVALFHNPPEDMNEKLRVGDHWLQATNKRLPDGSVVGIRLDITAFKQAEDQLHQAQKMEALGQLTGGVAHDFNNLLAVITGNVELLLEKGSPDTRQLETILGAASRGSELTQRLLSFSRRQALQPQKLDLNSTVAAIADILGRSLGETIEIETVAATDLWPCTADPGQLENALLNLALNARDAMPNGGKLTIETANAVVEEGCEAIPTDGAPGDYVVLVVRDTGCGMPPEVREHVFEPFFTTKPVGEGSGLGLSMVYGFVRQSGGLVTLSSEPHQGTTLRLYLPRFDEPEPSEPEPSEAQLAKKDMPMARGEAILVVEDDPDVCALTLALLDSLGYQNVGVSSAAAALDHLGSAPGVDLMLTDVVLGGDMNGCELALEAERRAPWIKVLYMSGYTGNAIAHHGRSGENLKVLQKPFRKADLAKALRRVLDGGPI